MISLSAADRQHLAKLLAPSWLSGLVAVVAGLVVAVGVIVAFSLSNSGIQQQLVAWQQTKPSHTLTTPDQTLPENDKPTLQGSWPLILVWSLIGLVTYVVAASVIHAISEAAALRQSLDYVHAKPRAILETTAEHLALRLVALATFSVLFYLFVKRIIPYSITAAHASAADVLSLSGLLYALLSFAVIVLAIHAQTIFLRLALGKVRVFPEL